MIVSQPDQPPIEPMTNQRLTDWDWLTDGRTDKYTTTVVLSVDRFRVTKTKHYEIIIIPFPPEAGYEIAACYLHVEKS